MRNKICLGLIALILVVGEFFWPEIKNAILFEHQSSGVDDGNICPSSRSLAIPKSAEEKTDTVLNPGVLGNPLGETILNKIANASSTLEDKKHPKNVFPAQGSAKINWFPANPRTGDNEEEGNGEKEEVQDDDQGMSLNSLLKSFSCTDVHSYNSSSTREGARNFLSEKSILERTSACSSYPRLMSSLNLSPATAEERDFPLAFAFTVHEDIGILELMLSLLFRPSDVHCIHVDKKADPEVRAAVQGLVDCYRQLFGQAASRILMAEQPVSVTWRHGGTIMEADRICYRELQRFRDWRYLINLAGTELPTVSIQRMRELLKREGGGRVVMDMTANHYFRVRQTFHYQPNKE